MITERRLNSLKESVPFGAREVIRVTVRIGYLSDVLCALIFLAGIYLLNSLPSYTTELLISKLLTVSFVFFLIPLTLVANAVIVALYELIADVSIDLRRLRLIQEDQKQVDYRDFPKT